MRKFLVLISLLLIIALNSCSQNVDKNSLLICGTYATPGMFYSDLKGKEADIEIIEVDSYGRILFRYYSPNFISSEKNGVVIICQKVENEYIYYYEDLCYSFSVDCEDYSKIKEVNDWNNPLDVTKMTKRQTAISFDLFLMPPTTVDYSTVQDLCCKQFNITQEDIIKLCLDDVDIHGNTIYYCEIKTDGNILRAVMFVSTNYECDYFVFDNLEKLSIEKFSAFKESNGWNKPKTENGSMSYVSCSSFCPM